MIFGLKNMGNTCYMNSMIQSLLSIEKLKLFLIENENIIGKNNCIYNDICKNFITLFKLTDKAVEKDEKNVITPKSLYESLCKDFHNDFFKSKKQQDSHEFYLFFLEMFEKVLNKKIDMFYGSYEISMKCCECSYFRQVIEDFNSVHLPCNFKEEIVENFNCEKCNKKTSLLKKVVVKKNPPILVLQVNKMNKKSKWEFEEHIYEIYDLKCIIFHSGFSINSGHYYSICKRNGQWTCFNDSSVSQASLDNINKEDIYILIYESNKN